ncbi:unnamed protein product [Rotaria sp. Silwood2]|nr:unnamed protein product [Rotaria sp. Silwood2]CAF4104998.1 unnamed protein product [Rotaria sp. Silwood2]
MGNSSSVHDSSNLPQSPFERMLQAKRKGAASAKCIPGTASDFYFFCRNGEVDRMRQVLDAEDAPSIDQLNELQPNGSTALHAATYYGHKEMVKFLLDRNCPRTALNRYGRTAYEEARDFEMKQLFDRPDSASRFHELNAAHTLSIYLPCENHGDTLASAPLNFVRVFKSESEILDYSINQQTTAMWLKFYNWFSHTFRTFIEREDFQIDAFDLHKHADFQQFLKLHFSDPVQYELTMKSIGDAQRSNSIEPLIHLYTSEQAGFYHPLNRQLAHSVGDAQMSPHLCDRFVIEFHLRRHELKHRAFTGTVYRGATVPAVDLTIYEQALASDPPGILGLKTFTSTSTDPLVALAFAVQQPPTIDQKSVLFVFEIREVTPTIIGVEDVSSFIQEHEVLILPGNLFIVTGIEEEQFLKVTKIYLHYWHVSVSFWKKLKQTVRSGKKTVL